MCKKVLKLVVLVMGIMFVFGGSSYACKNTTNDSVSPYYVDKDNDGNTSLHSACKNGYTEIVKSLLESGVNLNINEKDNNGDTPLHSACKRGYTEIVELFLDAEANKNSYTKIVHSILNTGLNLNINEKDSNGDTPLHCACQRGYTEMVKLFLRAGANLNERNNDGNTPLNLLCSNVNIVDKDIVELLVANGCDVNLKNNKNYTSLDSLYMLLNGEYNASVNMNCPYSYNSRPQHQKNVSKLIGVIETVLKNRVVSTSVKNENGDNLLNFACKHGYENIVNLLVNKK